MATALEALQATPPLASALQLEALWQAVLPPRLVCEATDQRGSLRPPLQGLSATSHAPLADLHSLCPPATQLAVLRTRPVTAGRLASASALLALLCEVRQQELQAPVPELLQQG